MKYCPKCGKALINDAAFCMYCGEKIDTIEKEQKQRKFTESSSKKKLIIGCTVVGVLAVLAILFMGSHVLGSKKLSPETNYLFSIYIGIQPVEVLGTDSFPDAEGEVIQENYSDDIGWDIVLEYCKDLESCGFKWEDLSDKLNNSSENHKSNIMYRLTKEEKNGNGESFSYSIVVWLIPLNVVDNIQIQTKIVES